MPETEKESALLLHLAFHFSTASLQISCTYLQNTQKSNICIFQDNSTLFFPHTHFSFKHIRKSESHNFRYCKLVTVFEIVLVLINISLPLCVFPLHSSWNIPRLRCHAFRYTFFFVCSFFFALTPCYLDPSVPVTTAHMHSPSPTRTLPSPALPFC